MIDFPYLWNLAGAATAVAAIAMCTAHAGTPAEWRRETMNDRQALATDPQRPTYHFVAPKSWMNDPNGLIQFRGVYHLFYQHDPVNPAGGNVHWGHATSRDLVHWQDEPIALRPDAPYDKNGVWSGCVVDDAGTATAIYTGVHPQVQCVATSKDLMTWEKLASNPVIAGPPEGLDVVGFRDPYVWKEGAEWRAVIGTGLMDVGGAVLLYRSADLRHWEYLHPALVGDKAKTGDMWECPNLFPLGDKWVLMVSTLGQSHQFIGEFRDGRFTPEREANTDSGGALYAPLTFRDAKGRRILFGWLWEQRGGAEKYGWQGVQSLPRVLTMGADGYLRYAPAREVVALRGKRTRVQSIAIAPDGSGFLPGVHGDAIEIDAKLTVGDAARVGLVVRRSPGGEEQTRIAYDAKAGSLSVDRTRSSTDATAVKDVRSTPFRLANGESLDLHVFVDHSVLEVFANGRACITSRIYPSRVDSLGVDAFAEGATASIVSLDAWTMKPIWPEAKG